MHRFEALLALTNIASGSDEIKEFIADNDVRENPYKSVISVSPLSDTSHLLLKSNIAVIKIPYFLQGVSEFESLQMSDHPMLRRAATEVLVNMADSQKVRVLF